MKINKVIKELKKIRNEYGNVEVTIFDITAWDRGLDNDCSSLEVISYDGHNKKVIIY